VVLECRSSDQPLSYEPSLWGAAVGWQDGFLYRRNQWYAEADVHDAADQLPQLDQPRDDRADDGLFRVLRALRPTFPGINSVKKKIKKSNNSRPSVPERSTGLAAMASGGH